MADLRPPAAPVFKRISYPPLFLPPRVRVVVFVRVASPFRTDLVVVVFSAFTRPFLPLTVVVVVLFLTPAFPLRVLTFVVTVRVCTTVEWVRRGA